MVSIPLLAIPKVLVRTPRPIPTPAPISTTHNLCLGVVVKGLEFRLCAQIDCMHLRSC